MSKTIFVLIVSASTTLHAQDAPKMITTPNYWTAVGVAAGMTTADAISSLSLAFHDPRGCAYESATPWLYTRTPQFHKMHAGTAMAGEVVLAAVASYTLKKHGRRFWSVPLAYTSTMHGQAAARNIYRCK